jgi:predicted transcriptional regulator
MLAPCEVAVKCALPAIRATLAKELMTKHDLTQAEAAKLIGVSQPAISLYCREIRGKAIDLENDPEITKLMESLATSLTEGMPRKDFIVKFCEICRTLRSKRLMCSLHKSFDPSIDIKKCELCITTSAIMCF